MELLTRFLMQAFFLLVFILFSTYAAAPELYAATGGLAAAGGTEVGVQATRQLVGGLVVAMLFIGSLFSSAWLRLDSQQVGFAFPHAFVRPVSTRRMVLVPLSFLVAVAVLSYLAPALLFRATTGIAIPLLGPVLLVAGLSVCLITAAWSTSTGVGRVVAILLVITAFVLSAVAIHMQREWTEPILLAMGRPDFYALRGPQLVGLAVWATASVAVCLRAAQCQRQGDAHWLGWHRGDPEFAASGKPQSREHERRDLTAGNQEPVSPTRAQVWFHWRECGSRLIMVACALPLCLAIIFSCFRFAEPNWRYLPHAWLMALLFLPVVYQILAAEWVHGLRRSGNDATLSDFVGALPVPNDRSIELRFLLIAVFSFGCWLMAAAIAAVHTTIFSEWGFWYAAGSRIATYLAGWAWYDVTLLLLAVAALFTLSSSLMLGTVYGLPLVKPRYAYVGQAIGYALLIIAFVDFDRGWQIDWFWYGVQAVATVVGLAICGGCLWLNIKRHTFGSGYACCATVVGVVALVAGGRVAMLAAPWLPPLSSWLIVSGAVSACIYVGFSMTLPPLALHLQRHR